MSIIINSHKSSWILKQTNCNGNVIIPPGGEGKLIVYAQGALIGPYIYSRNYGSSPTSTFASNISNISIRGNSNADVMEYTTVRRFIGDETKIWANYVKILSNGSNTRYFSKSYSPSVEPNSNYFASCASNADPFSYENINNSGSDPQFTSYGFTSGLSIGGYYVNNIPYDADSQISFPPPNASKIKFYFKGAKIAGYYMLNQEVVLFDESLETNTYLFGESDGTLNSVDYNTDCSPTTNPYTKNNLYLAKGTAKIVCCSENNEYQLVYFYQNSTYGTGVVLFKDRNFVKKLSQFNFANSLAMSYDGKVQAISTGTGNGHLYVSRNYGY